MWKAEGGGCGAFIHDRQKFMRLDFQTCLFKRFFNRDFFRRKADVCPSAWQRPFAVCFFLDKEELMIFKITALTSTLGV